MKAIVDVIWKVAYKIVKDYRCCDMILEMINNKEVNMEDNLIC